MSGVFRIGMIKYRDMNGYNEVASFTNCTCNYAEDDMYSMNKVLEIVADEDYYFEGEFTWYGWYNINSDDVEEFTFINEGNRLIAKVEDWTLSKKINENVSVPYWHHAGNGYVSLSGNYIATKEEEMTDGFVEGVIKYTDIRGSHGIASFTNCTCNYADGEIFNADKILEIVADDGYYFEGEFKWWGWYNLGLPNGDEFTFINEGNRLIAKVEEWQQKTTSYPNPEDNYYIFSKGYVSINENYVAIQEEVKTTTFVNIYNISTDELTNLGKARFEDKDNKTIDYGNYISNLYTIPFKIPSNIIVNDKTDIVLGNHKVDVLSSLITTNLLTIDIGTIYIPPKYNNVYDYINTMCILHLPFFDNIYIETEYIINQSIRIEYIIDLYVGNCTVNIYSSFIDNIIESRTTTISNNIPFMQNDNNKVIGSITSNNKNNINNAFIEIKRNKPYNKVDNILGSGVIEYGKIGDYEGYIQCNKVVLETNATKQEQEEIKNILGNGVFI